MKLSIVASLYMSAPYLDEFYARCSRAATQIAGSDFEIVLVNDGSPDQSLATALSLREKDDHIVVIDLSRNFGHHKAMMTGLMHARGNRVFLTDCDLEEPPEVLVEWWKRMNLEPEIDVIYGIQALRKGGLFERISGWLFYRLINTFSPVKLPTNAIVSRLMTAQYVQALTQHHDQEMYLFGLLTFAGFRQEAVTVSKHHKGSSVYTLFKRFSLFLNAVTNFSNLPLYLIFYFGLGISLLAFGIIVYFFTRRLLYPNLGITGWTSLLISVWGVGGVILTALGIIGIYLAKIFSETKPRPFTIIKRFYGKQNNNLFDDHKK